MRVHWRRSGTDRTLCGQQLWINEQPIKIADFYSEVDCKACMNTNWWRDAPGPNKLRAKQNNNPFLKMVEALRNIQIPSQDILRRMAGLPPLCKECKQPVVMMTMIGTPFCSPNCKVKHEDIKSWQAWSKSLSDQMLSKQNPTFKENA